MGAELSSQMLSGFFSSLNLHSVFACWGGRITVAEVAEDPSPNSALVQGRAVSHFPPLSESKCVCLHGPVVVSCDIRAACIRLAPPCSNLRRCLTRQELTVLVRNWRGFAAYLEAVGWVRASSQSYCNMRYSTSQSVAISSRRNVAATC